MFQSPPPSEEFGGFGRVCQHHGRSQSFNYPPPILRRVWGPRAEPRYDLGEVSITPHPPKSLGGPGSVGYNPSSVSITPHPPKSLGVRETSYEPASCFNYPPSSEEFGGDLQRGSTSCRFILAVYSPSKVHNEQGYCTKDQQEGPNREQSKEENLPSWGYTRRLLDSLCPCVLVKLVFARVQNR